jgi:hypothetical protein
VSFLAGFLHQSRRIALTTFLLPTFAVGVMMTIVLIIMGSGR